MSSRFIVVVALAASAALGCRQDMHDQPKYQAYEKNDFFSNGSAMRPLVEGVVARGTLRDESPYYTGKDAADAFVGEIPVEVTAELLERGRTEYQVFCSPCHGRTGMGDGMIVQRGFKRPSSYHVDRLREMPIGYFFDVMTNGFGAMSSYASQVPVGDRWAIAAYVRVLQLSQYAPVEDVPGDRLGELEASLQAPDAAASEAGEHH